MKQPLLPQLKHAHSSRPVVTMATTQGGKTLCIKEPRCHVRPGSAANEVVALGLQPRPSDA